MTTQDMLDDRYGRRGTPRRRWLIAALVAVAALALGYIGWVTVSNSLNAVDVDTTGFDVVDQHSVTLAFQVTAPAGRSVACALEAQDEEHGIVGWRIIEIEASDRHSRGFHESVPTTAPATTGFVNSCWVT